MNPEEATFAAQPRTPPVKTVSSFTPALQCMDELLWKQGKRDIYLTSAGIPDATGKISAGTKEMLITAVSRMASRSGAFRFVDYDPTQLDVQALSDLVGIREDFTVPSYYIRGAITQLDENVLSGEQGAAISLPAFELGVSRDQIVSVISMDLNLGHLVTRQILPGLSANNSIVVMRAGNGGDAAGRIGKAGLSINIALDRSEGFHQAVRTLVDLSAIELLGKLTRTPYWQCLEIDPTNPTFRSEAREWFEAMTPAERQDHARAVLAGAGYLDGAAAGGDAVREAIGRYQADHGLIAHGRVDFDLYYSLLGTGATLAGTPGRIAAAEPGASRAVSPSVERGGVAPTPAAARPLSVFLNTPRGPRPVYKPEELLELTVQPSRDAYVYCYYQDGNGRVARIYPNRFQPDALVQASQMVEIPPGTSAKPFNLRLDRAGVDEAVACVAATEEVGLRLPEPLKTEDLHPMPVRSLGEVIDTFKGVGGAGVSERLMAIKVIQ